ncbi:MAG TPA: hemolysin family protein [Planctomycetaceae bacterium]|nr:hemolysin family protein [Planctomycetaceae bacterium]
MTVWVQAAAVCILVVIALVGSFACEALRTFSRSRLDEACRRLGHPERFAVILRRAVDGLIAWRILTLLAVAALAALAGDRFAADLSHLNEVRDWLAVLTEPILLAAVFVLGLFVLPWSLARVTGERFLARCWPVLEIVLRGMRLSVAAVRRIDAFMHRLWGLKEPAGHTTESLLREVESVVDLGQREGILAPQARRMIERVIAAQQEDVSSVMTPRTEMECVPAAASLEEARLLMVAGGHSRMPVIGTSPDDIVGILYAKELLRHMSTENADPPLSLKDVVREPFYVPETIGLDKLLESMKRRGVHIAIVIDEYSGVAGLVTMEDVLEQFVGEIVDEYDTADDTGIRQVGPATVEVEPWVRIDDLGEQFAFDLPEDEDYDTVGGFVYAQLGRIPKRREVVAWKHLRVTVLDADKRRILKLRVENVGTPAPSSA